MPAKGPGFGSSGRVSGGSRASSGSAGRGGAPKKSSTMDNIARSGARAESKRGRHSMGKMPRMALEKSPRKGKHAGPGRPDSHNAVKYGPHPKSTYEGPKKSMPVAKKAQPKKRSK